jgi:hypothetical protein
LKLQKLIFEECSWLHREGSNAKIRGKLDSFNASNTILKSRSRWKHHVLQMDNNSKENVNAHPNNMTKHRAPIIQMEEPTYSSRGLNRPNMD